MSDLKPQAESLESLLSTAIGLLMGYEDRDGKGATRSPYKPGSVVAKFVAECVERLKDWPYTDEAQPAITSETGNQAAQGASAITSVPLLSEQEIVKCLSASGCVGTVKMSYDSGPYEITRTSVNADRFARAIESLVRSKLGAGAGWTACEDQMPEPGAECLVRVKALSPTQSGPTHYTHIDTWDEQHEAPVSWSSATIPVGLGWDSFDFEDVTHWMPLPPPPGIVGKEGGNV